MEALTALMVPMGIWDTIMSPLRWAVSGLLVFSHWIFSHVFPADSGATWVLSIVLLTVIIRTALIPLFVKQIRSSRNMQILQPKVRELQTKYAHDREKLGQETMKLYKDEGVNPMASCFPILLQMPIFFSLFEVLNGAARGHAVGYWMEKTPELVPSLQNATVFGAKISDKFWNPIPFGQVQAVALVLILAMTATTFFSQRQLMAKNMPAEALTGPMAQQQKMMLYLFPVIFAVGGVNFPVGVLIYWTCTNLWSMLQQFYVIRQSPTPGTEAYEAWEERMRAKGHDPKTMRPGQRAPRASTTVTGVTAEETAGTSEAAKPRVQRQQPQRQTRSNRKK